MKTIAFSSIGILALVMAVSSVKAESVLQVEEMLHFTSMDPQRSAATLTRKPNRITARLSLMDLDTDSAYTIWWVVFNEPGDCLIPDECGEDDIFSAPGVLNEDQIAAAKISVFYAEGFVTGADGTANVKAVLGGGKLPTGTGVNFGWQKPVEPGNGPNKSGLKNGKGMTAEVHVVVRSHGPAQAGMVGMQTSTFDGPCEVCEDQNFAVFRP